MSARARRAVTSFALLAGGLMGGGLALGIAPAAVLPAASAATCTSAGGVSVVVDFRELGGSTVTACAADGGGKSATAIFASVGVAIDYASGSPASSAAWQVSRQTAVRQRLARQRLLGALVVRRHRGLLDLLRPPASVA